MIDVMKLRVCPVDRKNRPLLSCVSCKEWPCPELSEEEEKALVDSPFTYYGEGSKFKPRRTKPMYIFRLTTGELKEAPKTFDPDKPDFDMLGGVKEILVVSKVLEKQFRLAVKSKGERDKIKAEGGRKKQ